MPDVFVGYYWFPPDLMEHVRQWRVQRVMRRAIQITLDESERKLLERLKRGRRVSVRLAERAAIVLYATDGFENGE